MFALFLESLLFVERSTVRVAPVPCVIKNYSLAFLTDIPWSVYWPATLAGLVPTTAAHVYAGTLAPSAADLAAGHGVVLRVTAAAGGIAGVAALGMLLACSSVYAPSGSKLFHSFGCVASQSM